MTIFEVLTINQGMSEFDADNLIAEAHEQFDSYIEHGNMMDAMNICEEFFSLEEDYLCEFM